MAFSDYVKLLVDGLLLRTPAYERMAEDKQPFLRGLILLILIGVIIALVGIVGTVLEWATTPDMGQIREAVRQGLMDMPWYKEMVAQTPEAAEGFKQGYEQWWQVFGGMLQPNVFGSLAGIVLVPLSLIVGWLIYGLLAHMFARLMGGEASLSQTYGATALGSAPQALNVITLVPYAQPGGLAIWGLVCNFLALKTAHRLSSGRAAWATLLPFAVLIIVVALVAFVVAAIVVSIVAGTGSVGR